VAGAWEDKVVELYKVSIDEYRFNVRLNWDRTQYFLGLNLAIVAAATGLVKSGPPRTLEYLLVAAIFAAGVAASLLGAAAATKGHNYYRAARDVVKSFELQLGLPANLGIASTEGMKLGRTPDAEAPDLGPAGQIPPSGQTGGSLRPGTVVRGAVNILRLITVLDLVGAGYAMWRACHA
jgi:hypothetical protein